MPLSESEVQKAFENDVRNVARQLWPEAQYEGARILDSQERDGVFETEDCIHLVEATVSRSKDKALTDSKKLVKLAAKLQAKNPQKAVKCWFVTRDEPTADQREVIKRHHDAVIALSFPQFQSKLVDASSYLNLRENYPFGSVRDPATGSPKAALEYVDLDIVQSSGERVWSIAELRSSVLTGSRFVLLGDYGAGKSMTLRELHRELRKAYYKGQTVRFPIYLNLRDHFGQTNPAEVLERHARDIGFAHPQHLVRAWRAGYVILLLDGFDELTTTGIQGLWKRLHDTRYRAMQAIRQFIRNQPADAGVVLTGRAHFFDSEKERKGALGLSAAYLELRLNEFNDEQIKRYLERKGLRGKVPGWMPSRPLLVGYLAATGILESSVLDSARDPATGWDLILDRVCEREAEIEAGIDGPTVRRILERLATMARSTQSGLGPLSRDQVGAAFAEVCGYQPDERGIVLLQRLPGLGIDRADEGTRVFLDEELADVCRAGDVIHFMSDPFGMTPNIFRGAECGLGALGIGLCVVKAEESQVSSGKMSAVIRRAVDQDGLTFLVLDLAQVGMELAGTLEIDTRLRDIYIPALELSKNGGDFSRLKFQRCLFSVLAIDSEVEAEHLPRFEGCYIDELEGRSSRRDLPGGVFDQACVIETFSEAPLTTDAIGGMDMPLGSRVLLTVLKKIYLQSGSGRKENALQRGLDHHGRRLVAPVLRLLQAEGLVIPYRRAGLDMTIWLPDRANAARVKRMITSPRTCADPLLLKAAELA